MKSTRASFADLPKTYEELVAGYMPRPIHDAVGYRNTVEWIDALAGHPLTSDQEDYLELLSQLVESYEASLPRSPAEVTGISALAFLLREHAMTGDDLAGLLQVDRSVAYKILKGSRSLTAGHIKKLAVRFNVSGDLFLA